MKKPAKKARKRDLITETKDAAQTRRRARLDALVALIEQRMTDVVADFWDIGHALAEIVDDKLYLAEGHRTLDAFLKAHKLLSRAQASKLMAVARSMPRAEAVKLGAEKSYALLAFTNATPEDDTPAGLMQSGARFEGRTVESASVRDIEASTRAVREKHAATRTPSPAQKAKQKADAALGRAVTRALKEAGLSGATVTVTARGVRAQWTREIAEKRVAK